LYNGQAVHSDAASRRTFKLVVSGTAAGRDSSGTAFAFLTALRFMLSMFLRHARVECVHFFYQRHFAFVILKRAGAEGSPDEAKSYA
jgi:hypothetical protein